ncbi:MAG: glycoside hydrolase family 88 protein, partial [Lachnospiraceae bacterium]|nr:glycoside hydrolase family 88 protein [Lachnospiraceae bacterium]
MNKIPLIENACKELMEYGVRSRQEKCKDLAKRLILHRKTPGEDPIFWPNGLLAVGLWHCREEFVKSVAAVDNQGRAENPDIADGAEKKSLGESMDFLNSGSMTAMIDQSLAAYYGRWQQKGMPIAVLDDLLSGETMLNMYRSTREKREDFGEGISEETLKNAVDRLASYGADHPTDAAGSFIYRPANGEKTVFVDGVGLSCPFLYRYGEIFARQEFKELAVLQIVNFLSYGMDGKSGLPYHGYDMTDGLKYGIIGWGRAAGWLLRGMVGCMVSAYGRERLAAPCVALVDALLAYQRQDGFFSWQLEAVEGPADTSATGMICAGLKQGMAMGVFAGEKYENALTAGQLSLERSVRDGRVYHCSGECEGFSQYPQRYGAYPWPLGPALEVLQTGRTEDD